MISAVFCVLFGLSLLPGRKPLCLRYAERISDGILPDGAQRYCVRLTWVWFAMLLLITLANIALLASGGSWIVRLLPGVCAAIIIPIVFVVEKRIRDRRFAVVFHTSGSTGRFKTIVKTFETLAKETAMHRRMLAGVVDGAKVLSTIDPTHMYGTLWRRMIPAAMGLEVDPEIILTPEALVDRMRRCERVMLVTTPSFLDRFTAYADQYDVPRNCVEIVTSGALLTGEVSDRTERVFGIAPRQIFGSTETGGVAWRRGGGEFKVFDEVKVSVRDGRLEVRSPFSFMRRYVMGDGVKLAEGGRSFTLLGRMDRLVKINEERVNLAEMENKVRALGYRDCALVKLTGRRGDFLGLVLVGGDGREDALALRRKMLPVFPKGCVPKRFRKVDELPRNHQGKVVAAEIAKLFDSCEVKMKFDGNERFFDGHFPGAPVLPGVMQVDFAVRHAQNLTSIDSPVKEIRKMKFVRVIQPGDEIVLKLARADGDAVGYTYLKGEDICSSGVLQF